jgi:D-glycero-alpha-D-manno-heptose-7-phosphate kinase
MDVVKSWDEIKNPLIRETLKFAELNKTIDLNTFSDIPSRTGLGGSSAFCVGLLKAIRILQKNKHTKKELAEHAIHIERFLLNDAGGIQDQIWAAYGGMNSIEIDKLGRFFVKPIPITDDFKHELKFSMLLIYTNHQRDQDDIAKSHENTNKLDILGLSKHAYTHFLEENIRGVGEALYESWLMKMNISKFISSSKINDIINKVMSLGAYGAKLLGAGGCGFVLVICNPIAKSRIKDVFGDSIMDFEFEFQGASEIFTQKYE